MIMLVTAPYFFFNKKSDWSVAYFSDFRFAYPASLRSWDNSTCKLQSQMTFRLCTLFLKLGSH
jgi:hypothetical protein